MSANTETTGAVKVGDVFERVTDIDSHRRAGSQFTIEEVDDEYAHWERRLYCLRPEHLLDSTRYRRIVTPPIAAPAAHIERRKGQRWKSVRTMARGDTLIVTGTLTQRLDSEDGWVLSNVERSDGIGAFDSCFVDSLWSNPSETMTLLADAPPEPAKLRVCTCPHGPHTTDGKCPVHVTAGIPLSGFVDCPCAKRYPPAQEAPKAAPVCGNNGCKTPQRNVAQRWSPRFDNWGIKTGVDLEWSCEPCHLLDEKEFAGLMAFESTGKPYAGPERLPRPQLAADWVWDCLPEGGR